MSSQLRLASAVCWQNKQSLNRVGYPDLFVPLVPPDLFSNMPASDSNSMCNTLQFIPFVLHPFEREDRHAVSILLLPRYCTTCMDCDNRSLPLLVTGHEGVVWPVCGQPGGMSASIQHVPCTGQVGGVFGSVSLHPRTYGLNTVLKPLRPAK